MTINFQYIMILYRVEISVIRKFLLEFRRNLILVDHAISFSKKQCDGILATYEITFNRRKPENKNSLKLIERKVKFRQVWKRHNITPPLPPRPNYLKKSFSYSGSARLWNSLSSDLRVMSSLLGFTLNTCHHSF